MVVSFGLLGPLLLRIGEQAEVTAAKQRTVLALLIARRNIPVSLERIVDEVWPEQSPESAVQNARTYISAIRAVAGYAVSLLSGWPIAIGPVIGTLLGLVTLVVADRRRWGSLWTEYSWGDSPETTQRVCMQLKGLGYPVDTTTYPDGRVRLRYRQRDSRRVAMALNRLGIRPPGRW